MKRTIKDIEGQAEQNDNVRGALKELGLLPEGYRYRVRLHGESRDKRRTASFERSWSPDTDSIIIDFEPDSLQRVADPKPLPVSGPVASPDDAAKSGIAPPDPLSDLVQALYRAESRPGYRFVALKWFRDTALPSEGFAWASDDFQRRNILRDAIDKRVILTSKEPNPKDPQYPVTAIRLNRLMPQVQEILGNRIKGTPDFQPISIRGENLSQTVLRDRR